MPGYLVHKADALGFADVYETVRAVEKIAASGIHVLRGRVLDTRAYVASAQSALAEIARYTPLAAHPFLAGGGDRARLSVLVTGDHALVGGLFHALVALSVATPGPIIAVGHKGAHLLEEQGRTPVAVYPALSEALEVNEADAPINEALGRFERGEVGGVDIIYAAFVSLGVQHAARTAYLPLPFVESGAEGSADIGLPVFEPSAEGAADALVRLYVRRTFFAAMLEAKLSELSARAVEMESASAKAKELSQTMQHAYLRERRRDLSQKQVEGMLANNL